MNAAGTPPDGDTLLARALALVPELAARRARAASDRMVPSETIADFVDAGFFRMLQPRRWGGFESHPNEFFDVQQAIATACPSSAWVLGVVAVHNWQLALFPDKAQHDVWGEDSSVRISSSYMPVGKVTPVEGGFRFSGTWGFSSGCDHCDWVFLGGFVPTDGGPPDMHTFLVPRADYRIVDDWHVLGLQGTGSKTIVVDDAFVPEHRTHRFADGFKCQSPGHAENDAPLFRLPFGQIFVRSVSLSSREPELDYGFPLFVDGLRRFLDELELERVSLVGNSMGGAMCIRLALDEPERVDKLILMAPGGLEAREVYMGMRGIRRMLKALFGGGPLTLDSMKRVFELQVFRPEEVDDDVIAERLAVAPEQPRAVFENMRVPNQAAELGELDQRCWSFGERTTSSVLCPAPRWWPKPVPRRGSSESTSAAIG